jgi:peroxiredoxin
MNDQSVSIADRVAELRASRAPSPIFTAEQEALAKTSPVSLVSVGSPFPDGDLVDAQGRSTTLGNVLGGAPGVVIFYRGAWCPYCNIALRTYREQLVAPLAERGVALVAISPQTADGSLTFKEKLSLDFAVLSDPGNQIAGADGNLAWIDIHPDYTTRTEPSQILEQVSELAIGHQR